MYALRTVKGWAWQSLPARPRPPEVGGRNRRVGSGRWGAATRIPGPAPPSAEPQPAQSEVLQVLYCANTAAWEPRSLAPPASPDPHPLPGPGALRLGWGRRASGLVRARRSPRSRSRPPLPSRRGRGAASSASPGEAPWAPVAGRPGAGAAGAGPSASPAAGGRPRGALTPGGRRCAAAAPRRSLQARRS